MRIPVKLASSAAVLLAVPLLVSGGASSLPGATTLGGNFVPETGSTCVGNYTFLQTTSPGSRSTALAPGVITAFRFQAGSVAPASITFKVGRPAPSNTYRVTGSSNPVPVTASQALEAPARISVQPGDVIGFYVSTGGQCLETSSTGYQYHFFSGNAGPNDVMQLGNATRLDVEATLEPDADGDGFGDLTQDRCSTDKSTQGPCPPAVVDRTAPETTITSVVAKKAKSAGKKASVTATFAASETSTFECAVDSPVFVSCSSPYVTKLKVGKHTLAVRATDAAGNVDRSAAVTSVKVKVGKPKK